MKGKEKNNYKNVRLHTSYTVAFYNYYVSITQQQHKAASEMFLFKANQLIIPE